MYVCLSVSWGVLVRTILYSDVSLRSLITTVRLACKVAATVDGALVIQADIRKFQLGGSELGPETLVLIAPLVVTNVVATCFVGYKAW